MFSDLCRVVASAKEPKAISIILVMHVVSMRTISMTGAPKSLCSKLTVRTQDWNEKRLPEYQGSIASCCDRRDAYRFIGLTS